MALPPPRYDGVLTEFISDLRSRLFSSQRETAEYFGVTHPTINRYENGVHRPHLGYLAALIRLLVERQEEADADTYRNVLFSAANRAIRDHYQDLIFASWAELTAVADAYLAKSRKSKSANQRNSDREPSSQPKIEFLTAMPAEAPPLPHFYVERESLQQGLRDKVKDEKIHTMVLWGQGGTGKSTLAAWLARQAEFEEGHLWLTLPDNLMPEESVAEAQMQLARSFGVMLDGLSLAERAGQLRTLLHHRRCLIVVDDVWITTELEHLQVVNEQSCLLLTTRYKKVADVLEAPYLHVTGMTDKEGLMLLTNWANYPVTTVELVSRLGGLPLALKLSGVQLRDESTPAELLTYFQHNPVGLDHLDLDHPQNETDSLSPCFDRSLNRLTLEEQAQLARLSCFIGRFDVVSGAAVGELSTAASPRILRRWYNLALLEREERHYKMHPLLRDYVRQKRLASPSESQTAYRRHAVYHIRHYLYHPHVLDDVTDEAPRLDENWGDVVAGVRWAIQSNPQLATIAVVLAHAERAALLKSVGPSLTINLEAYLLSTNSKTEQATLHEILGDLQLLSDKSPDAIAHFDQAALLWQSNGYELIGIRARLRLAGIHLLRQDKTAAVEALSQTQALLSNILPIANSDLEAARWLFYWFDILYTIGVKWGAFELLEPCATEFVDLAQKTKQPLLEARGWHIYQLLHTAPELSRPEPDQQRGRQYAAKAAWLWWRHGDKNKALVEIMWTQERTKKRRSRRMAEHFARRLSRATPQISPEQLDSNLNQSVREWLTLREDKRVDWLIKRLPPPGDDDWSALDDILSISTMGEQTRRLTSGLPYPDDHIVSKPLWKILTGQRPMPLFGQAAEKLVKQYLSILDSELK